jgi:sugar-specific transcriptional regulator TrmB
MKITSKQSVFLGLEEKEHQMLNALEDKTPYLIQEISELTNIPRTTLYTILPSLEERSLLVKRKVGKKTKWKKNIKKYLAEFENIFGKESLSATSSGKTSTIQIETEPKRMSQAFVDITNVPEGSRISGIQPKSSISSLSKKMDLESVITFNNNVKEKELIVEGIIHEDSYVEFLQRLSKEDSKRFLKSFGERSADTSVLPPEILSDTSAEILMSTDRVTITNWEKNILVTISDPDISKLVKHMFDATKYHLSKYNQNEKIAKELIQISEAEE